MKDPVDRYTELARRLGWSQPSPATDSESLVKVIRVAPAGTVKTSLADHLAKNSILTADDASRVVQYAFDSLGGEQAALGQPERMAAAVSAQALTATGSFGGDLELSDPVLLDPWVRIVAAAVMGSGLLLAITLVGTLSATTTSWGYGALLGIGLGCLAGITILVMGYKNVTIRGQGSPPGAT